MSTNPELFYNYKSNKNSFWDKNKNGNAGGCTDTDQEPGYGYGIFPDADRTSHLEPDILNVKLIRLLNK